MGSDFESDEPALAAVDWGTSSFRLWVLNRSGAMIAESVLSAGHRRLNPRDYGPLLEGELERLGVKADIPAIVCGMAGAVGGWHEAGYIRVPANLDDIPGSARILKAGHRPVCILPGVAQYPPARADVMRGEETVLLGLMAEVQNAAIVACIPGTHSKWVTLRDRSISEFSTCMTGEMYSILTERSSLAPFLQGSDDMILCRPTFSKAVAEAASSPDGLIRELFSVRARGLLSDVHGNEAQTRLSGLLIGHELGCCRGGAEGKIVLIASGTHAETYSLAFDVLGLEYELQDGFLLAQKGLYSAARKLWPDRLSGNGQV